MKRLRVLPLVATLALACWLRVSGYPNVLADGSVRPLTNDAVYHVRRSLETVRQFPRVPMRDPLLGWPHGDDCLWAPGYDFISALFVLALGAGGDEPRAAAVVVSVPVVLGLFVVLLAGRVARALALPERDGSSAAAIARLLCAGTPIAIFSSQLGRADHHVTEALTVLLLLLVTLARVGTHTRVADAAKASLPARWRFELGTAGAIAFGLFVWTGSTLYVVLALLVLVGAAASEPTSPERPWPDVIGSGAAGALLGAALGLAGYTERLRTHGWELSYLHPSPMQPGIVALAGVGLLATLVAARLVPLRAGTPPAAGILRRLLVAATLALPVYALAFPLVAELWRGAGAMLDLTGTSPSPILEFQPLVRADEALSAAGWAKALRYFGPLALVGLPLALLGVASVARHARAEALVLGSFTAALIVLTARQSRFARELAPVLAVAAAIGLQRCAQLVLPRGPSFATRPWASDALGLVLGLVLVLAAEPTWRRLWPSAKEPPRAAQAASLYLAAHAQPRADGSRAGALTDSFSGAFMMWPARVPVVANNLGGKPELSVALSGDEARALAFMTERELAWFVPNAEHWVLMQLQPDAVRLIVLAPDGRGVIDPEFLRRVPLATSLLGGGGIPELGVAHLTELMPRFASADGLPGLAFFMPSAWVYERVAGARLRGRATPQDVVMASLELRASGHRLPYVAWTRADERGDFVLRLPLPSRYRSDALSTEATYAIGVAGSRDAPRRVPVLEPQVRAGAEVELGSLTASPAE